MGGGREAYGWLGSKAAETECLLRVCFEFETRHQTRCAEHRGAMRAKPSARRPRRDKNPTSTLRGLEGEKRKVRWTFRRPEPKFAQQISGGGEFLNFCERVYVAYRAGGAGVSTDQEAPVYPAALPTG